MTTGQHPFSTTFDHNSYVIRNPSVVGQSSTLADAKFNGILEPIGYVGNDLLIADYNNFTIYKIDLSSPDRTVTNIFDFADICKTDLKLKAYKPGEIVNSFYLNGNVLFFKVIEVNFMHPI